MYMENFKTKVGAILLDTRSIQRYVFGCNQLITNTGASYLVDAIYNEAMIDVLKHHSLYRSWQKSHGEHFLFQLSFLAIHELNGTQ